MLFRSDFIIDAIVEWLKGLLVDGIMGNLDGLFDNVNQSVGEIATQVGTTPADWNAGVFSMIRQISETAILPIAGVILTFVMTYELIQMLIERNNLHEVDTWMFFKWVFKTFVAVMILTNTFNIVLAVFDVSQHVIQQSAGIIQNGTEITPDVLDSLRTELEAMELGPLFGLWLLKDYSEFQDKYDSLKADERRLDRLFEKTCYAKEIDEMAAALVESFISHLSSRDDLEKAAVTVAEGIKDYSTGKRGR